MTQQTQNLPAPAQSRGILSVYADIGAFEDAQRIARALAASDLVPRQYQNNVANCLILIDTARRMALPVLQVASGLNVIHGRPTWGAQFIIAAINASGQFSPLRFEWRGAENTDAWACRAYATDLKSGDRLTSPWVGIAMAKAEGWYDRKDSNGRLISKWRTMPELMMMYRAGSFFGRMYAGHILSGMQTTEELVDSEAIDVTPTTPAGAPATATTGGSGAAAMNAEIGARRRRRSATTIDASTGEVAPPPPAGAPPITPAQAASIEAASAARTGAEDAPAEESAREPAASPQEPAPAREPAPAASPAGAPAREPAPAPEDFF